MPRFFVDPENVTGEKAFVKGQDAVHIGRSLRMRLGDEVIVCCGGEDLLCKIDTISDKECQLTVLEKRESITEPTVELTLYQAMPKSDKLELIVQKAVELGAARIVPVMTARCVSRPDSKSFRKKQERLGKIALEAAKQCGRSKVPQIGELLSFDEAVESLCEKQKALVCYEKGGVDLRKAVAPEEKEIGLFIGSEGGFEAREVEQCEKRGAQIISLGNRILRCETAPIAAISVIMSLTGNL